MRNVKGLIIDMDGVVWNGKAAIGQLENIADMLERASLPYRFATNNSTRSRSSFSQKLSDLGWSVDETKIITSSIATSHYLKELHPAGGPVMVIGESGLREALTAMEFFDSVDNPLAVVVGLDRNVTYQTLSRAALAIRAGVPFIGTNPDNTLPSPEGQVPGAGSLLAALVAATGINPRIVGKPQPDMLLLAARSMGLAPRDCLVVGDRLETDIAGGHAAGCRTALVLSGVSTPSMVSNYAPAPDYIAPDFTSLLESLLQ